MELTRHLLVVPILLPLVAGASLLLIDETRHTLKALVSLASTVLLLVASVALMRMADGVPGAGGVVSLSYAVASWPAPFAIVLVLDRLSALMLVLTAVLAFASLVFSLARWHRAGPHFHTLFQFLLMGLAGAFLTGDLFNLFVFFEVTLAASYGLLLHGSGAFRVRSGLHYIAINLVASLLFLIGASLIYGVAGTLNMADLAVRLHTVPAGDRMLLQAGAAILGVAFLVKAGMWPLCFWLPSAYTAAAAPVGAIFVVLTKVGVYVLLRLTLLLFGSEAGELTGFGGVALLWGGIATVAFAASGVLASQSMGRLAGYSVLVSSGTLLAAVGMGDAAVVSGALFYLVSSTLATAAFFMLIELVERAREPGADLLAVTREAYGENGEEEEEREDEEVGVVMPGALAVLGICFGCVALLLAGLPPLSGFIAKFAMLTGMLNLDGLGTPTGIPPRTWLLVALIILSGLAALVAMMRSGIRTFWAPLETIVPRVLVVEVAPIVALLALCLLLTIRGGAMIGYTEAAAGSLHDPSSYIQGVLGARQPGSLGPMSRVLPYPILTVALLLMWMLLTAFTPGQFLLGGAVAIAASRAMAALQPAKPKLRRWQLIPRLVGIVMLDILQSNIAVAGLILRGGGRERTSGFVAIPLDLRDRTGLAVLACIVTSTPGTAWVEYAHDANVLLIHVLDLVDEEEWVALIKDRYESLLMEIFE